MSFRSRLCRVKDRMGEEKYDVAVRSLLGGITIGIVVTLYIIATISQLFPSTLINWINGAY